MQFQPAHHLAQPAQRIADGDAGAAFRGIAHQAGSAIRLVLGLHRLQRQRHHSARLGRRGDDVLAQLRIALLRHGGTADRARRHRFLHFPEFGLHQRVDLTRDLAAGRSQQAEQHHVLRTMVADGARGHAHGAHAEMTGYAVLHRRPLFPERGIGARRAAEHGDEQARGRLVHPFDMAQQFVDPGGDLVAERAGHGVLAVCARGNRHVGAALGQVGHGGEDVADQIPDDPVRLAQHQQVAGLGDVLRGRTPMHPAAMRLADDTAQLPDQRHQRMARAGEALVDARAIHQLQPGLHRNRVGRLAGNDAEFRLGDRQGRLDIQPSLPAVFQTIQRPDTRIGHSSGRRQRIAHGARLHRTAAPLVPRWVLGCRIRRFLIFL